MDRYFQVSDAGKPVVTDDGEVVGTVERIVGAHAHVAPAGDVDQALRGWLGWPDEDDGTHRLGPGAVEAVEDDAVRLRPAE